MPELPEVETVKRHLLSQVKGLTVKEAILHYPRMYQSGDVAHFKSNIVGRRIVDIKRRGKYLIFELSDAYLISHLRMEGKFFYGATSHRRDKHTHAQFLLSNGETLYYEDVRKFGTFHLYDKSVDLTTTPTFSQLGPEPFDENVDQKYLLKAIKNKKTPIKSLLLNQKVVAGLGNIYVDEVLFAAKTHPLMKSGDLNVKQARDIVQISRDILSRAIEMKGTTIKTFASMHGSGNFGDFLQVHTKKDAPCPTCQTPIEKIKVGGRGTYFCPKCQRYEG